MVNPLSESTFRQKGGAVIKEARESTSHIRGRSDVRIQGISKTLYIEHVGVAKVRSPRTLVSELVYDNTSIANNRYRMSLNEDATYREVSAPRPVNAPSANDNIRLRERSSV